MKELYSLIEQLNNSDEKAFEEIYKRCSGHVTFVCNNFCDSKEDVEEVVQDTFLIAFKKAGTLKSETFMGYLRKIAIHESLRKRNINLRLQNYVVSVDDEQTENLPELNIDFLPEQHLQDKENRTELLQIIKSLPAIQWEMVYMYYYADFSTKEIARLYDCSESNVYNTLRRARNTIKAKLEDTNKKVSLKGMAVVSLAALFFMEEEIFAASYIPTSAPSIVSAATTEITATAAEAATKSIKGYVIAVCVVATCAVSVIAYSALQPGVQEYAYEPYEPVYEIYTPVVDEIAEEYEEDILEEIPPLEAVEEPEQAEEPEETPEAEPEEEQIPEVVAEQVQEAETEQLLEPAEEPRPEEVYELEVLPEPEPEEEPIQAEAPEPVYEPESIAEPDPIPVDRTPEILAALAVANNAEDVANIINNHGFVFDTQIHSDMWYRFYVLDEGSGDIMIGIATHADGSAWRMRFVHFENGTMPLDILELLHFMEQ